MSPNTWKYLNVVSKWKLKKKIETYLKKNVRESQSLEKLKGVYIEQLLMKVPDYYTEVYSCESSPQCSVVSINFINYSTDYMSPCTQPTAPKIKVELGLYIDRELFCNFADLLGVTLKKNIDKWSVLVNRMVHMPRNLIFENEESAISFISGIDGYYRIVKNFYSSLCPEVEPPSLVGLRGYRIHAPLSKKFACDKLESRPIPNIHYILRQDEENFSSYWVTLYWDDSIQHWHIATVTEDGRKKYKMEGAQELEPVEFENMNHLSKVLQDIGALQINGCMVKTREACSCNVIDLGKMDLKEALPNNLSLFECQIQVIQSAEHFDLSLWSQDNQIISE
ncbi:hypothetical protein ScPMuIL_008745 [Solemya velum]